MTLATPEDDALLPFQEEVVERICQSGDEPSKHLLLSKPGMGSSSVIKKILSDLVGDTMDTLRAGKVPGSAVLFSDLATLSSQWLQLGIESKRLDRVVEYDFRRLRKELLTAASNDLGGETPEKFFSPGLVILSPDLSEMLSLGDVSLSKTSKDALQRVFETEWEVVVYDGSPHAVALEATLGRFVAAKRIVVNGNLAAFGEADSPEFGGYERTVLGDIEIYPRGSSDVVLADAADDYSVDTQALREPDASSTEMVSRARYSRVGPQRPSFIEIPISAESYSERDKKMQLLSDMNSRSLSTLQERMKECQFFLGELAKSEYEVESMSVRLERWEDLFCVASREVSRDVGVIYGQFRWKFTDHRGLVSPLDSLFKLISKFERGPTTSIMSDIERMEDLGSRVRALSDEFISEIESLNIKATASKKSLQMFLEDSRKIGNALRQRQHNIEEIRLSELQNGVDEFWEVLQKLSFLTEKWGEKELVLKSAMFRLIEETKDVLRLNQEFLEEVSESEEFGVESMAISKFLIDRFSKARSHELVVMFTKLEDVRDIKMDLEEMLPGCLVVDFNLVSYSLDLNLENRNCVVLVRIKNDGTSDPIPSGPKARETISIAILDSSLNDLDHEDAFRIVRSYNTRGPQASLWPELDESEQPMLLPELEAVARAEYAKVVIEQ